MWVAPLGMGRARRCPAVRPGHDDGRPVDGRPTPLDGAMQDEVRGIGKQVLDGFGAQAMPFRYPTTTR
jgi:hypothetical protein